MLSSHCADEESGAQKVYELAQETRLVCGQLGAGPVSWGRWMSDGGNLAFCGHQVTSGASDVIPVAQTFPRGRAV